MIHNNIQRKVFLYWGARARQDLYMLELAESWEVAHNNIKFIPVLSDALPEDLWRGHRGLVHQAVINDFSQFGLKDYEVYCCGSPAMVEVAQTSFLAHGLAETGFFADIFSYAKPV